MISEPGTVGSRSPLKTTLHKRTCCLNSNPRLKLFSLKKVNEKLSFFFTKLIYHKQNVFTLFMFLVKQTTKNYFHLSKKPHKNKI